MSESKSRIVVKEWVGDAPRSEEIPTLILKGRNSLIELRPWCYIFNLVGYVLRHLDTLKSLNKLFQHSFIPDDEIHLKIGGDHGGGSFKMSFQVGNVLNPNKPENTVIFSTQKPRIKKLILHCAWNDLKLTEQFNKIKWQNKKFRIFLFRDYEFLCSMYGLSGASGRYPCLWCHIPSSALAVYKEERENMYPPRTLETLTDNLNLFQVTFNHDLKQAKNAYNVIDDIFFKIPLDHVCIPGLHVTLRVYLKLFHEFDTFCKDMGLQIAHVLALDNEEHENIPFNKFVETLKGIRHMERSIFELEERRNVIIEELNWFATSQADYFDKEFYISKSR